MAEEWRGRIGGMSKERIDRFLATDMLCRLAVIKPDGSPYVIPVWYQWDGEALWFVGRERSEWCRFIKANPKVSVVVDAVGELVIDGEKFAIPKVFFEGEAEVVEEPNVGGRWVAVAEEMSIRYFGPNGPSYLDSTRNQPRWLIRMKPTRMRSWEGVGWSPKYWVEGTGGPSYEEVHGR